MARYKYLSLNGRNGRSTFGSDRYLNQKFYTSTEWRQLRSIIILRDSGCDLGIEGYEIMDRLVIHHMNPIVTADLRHGNKDILDPEYMITTTSRTHSAIHYGDENLLPRKYIARHPGDTNLW